MPTDESLPRFLIRPSSDEDPFKSTILHSHDYRPAEAAYIKHRSKHPDEYSVALLDAYIPDILFAQVLAKPTISTPSLSVDEIRRQNNGGSPTLPTITLPTEFTVQLYNPESQVHVKHKLSKWTGSYWEFTLPKRSFRQPTGSRLDAEVARASALPPTDVSTFRWRKDGGVVSKTSLRCAMLSTASSSHDPNARKKGGGEPDITVAIMDKLKDVTIYEPNLNRVDVEDRKGLELVLLLTATVIADIYFTQPSHTFNVSPQSSTTASTIPSISTGVKGNSTGKSTSPTNGRAPPITLTKAPTPPNNAQTVVNPNVLAETARLQRMQSEEERRRARETEAEQRRIKKMLEQEEKERRRKEAKVAEETERLRKKYGQDTQAWQALQRDPQRQPQRVPATNGRPTGFGGYHQSRPSVQHPPSSYLQTPPPQPPRPLSQQLPPSQPLYPVPERQQIRPSPQHLSPISYSPSAVPYQQEQPRRKASGFLKVFSGSSGTDNGKLTKKKSSFW